MVSIITKLPTIEWIGKKYGKKLKYLVVKIVAIEGSLVTEKLDKGLLEMKNTPGENGLSTAQMVFGYEMRSLLPAIRSAILKEKRMNYYN